MSDKMKFIAKYGGHNQIHDLLTSDDWRSARLLIRNPCLNVDHATKILTSTTMDEVLQAHVAKQPYATKEHIELALKSPHQEVRKAIFGDWNTPTTFKPNTNPAITHRVVKRGMEDLHPLVRFRAMQHPLADPDQIKWISENDPHMDVRLAAGSIWKRKTGQL